VGSNPVHRAPECNPGQVVYTRSSVTKQYNLVLAYGRWCSAAGEVTAGLGEVMAAYRRRRVYGFGHLRADCRGPRSAPELYSHFKYGKSKGKVDRAPLESIGGCSSPSSRPWARRWRTTNVYDAWQVRRQTYSYLPSHFSLAGTKLYCLVTEALV